jgi:phospholipase D1/2
MGPGDDNNRRMHRAIARLSALCVLGLGMLAFWRYSPLADWSDPDRLGELLEQLSTSPWAGAIVVAAFLVGSFLVFPVTALIAATGIALGPSNGLLWASIGSLVGAVVTYGCARLLPDRTLESWIGPWVCRLGRRCERGGIVSVMLARNIPVAPFTLINVVSGAAGIPFRDYLIGTCLGMAPTIGALTVLGDRLRGAWEAPTALNIIVLCLAIVLWIVIAMSLQYLSNRWAAAR